MNLRDLITDFDGRLTKADQKLISVLFAAPAEGTYLRARDLAARAGVHATTAVRLAQKLGFRGYPEMRAQFRLDVHADNHPDQRIRQRLDKMAERGILHSLIDSEIQALQAIPDHISQRQMDAAADALSRAGRIVVFGQNHSDSLADLMARRLVRSGANARAFHHIDWEAPEIVMAMRPGDVILAFAFRRVPAHLEALLQFGAGNELISIVVSDLIGPFMRPQPDILLATPRGEEGESQSLTVAMAVGNALILELSKRDDSRSMRSLTRMADVEAELDILMGK